MVFNSDFMKLYDELCNINNNVFTEGKKSKNKVKTNQQTEVDHSKEIDSFLYKTGLVRISEIAPECSNFSPSGTAIWVPSEQSVNISYKDDIPYFNKLASNRLPKFVNELPIGDYPLPKWSPKTIQNNGDRKVFDVDLGEINNNPWRGSCFRFRVANCTYFIFGKIFYKGYQKVNASTNRDIAAANNFYDKIMKEIEKYKNK